MRHVSTHYRTLAGSLAGLTLALTLGSAGLMAQAGAVARANAATQATQAIPAGPSAEQIREEFIEVLQRYPPQVGQILKLDPSLLNREDYLAPYPTIGAFLAQHPEVRRSPEYFLSRFGSSSYVYDARSRAWDQMMEMFSIVTVAGTFVFGFAWLIRNAMDYRRWGRQAKVQAEAHTKLLDRLTSNDELLSYVQSPAGSRFLQSAPITLDGKPKAMGAPFSRILWSMQAGVVLAAAGIGLNYVSRRVHPDSADPVFTMSVILLSVGIGFFASAGLSFLLSKRLGLIGGDRQETDRQG